MLSAACISAHHTALVQVIRILGQLCTHTKSNCIALQFAGARSTISWYDFEGRWEWKEDRLKPGMLTVVGMAEVCSSVERLFGCKTNSRALHGRTADMRQGVVVLHRKAWQHQLAVSTASARALVRNDSWGVYCVECSLNQRQWHNCCCSACL